MRKRTTNSYSSILSRLHNSVWYITEESFENMMEILERHMRHDVHLEAHLAQFQSSGNNGGGSNNVHRGIGILGLEGPIFPKANMMTEMSGATSLQQFQQDFRALMNNDFVSTILLEIDSPGGHADLVPEMAAEIRRAREHKPIVAVANTAMNSAAYYLGAQASSLYATPSAQVGSIGTFLVHTDETRKDEMEGVKRTYISGGDYKTELFKPLTAEAEGRLQDYVDYHYSLFVNDVAAGRNVSVDHVLENFGQGSVFHAEQAEQSGMVDGVLSFDQVLSRLIESGGDIEGINSPPVGVSARSDRLTLRESYDGDKEHSEPGTGQGGEPTPREPPEKGDKAIEGGWRRDPPPIAYEPEESVMDRAQLEGIATTLGIEFATETSDEDLGNLVTARVDQVVVPINTATQEAETQRQWEQDYPEQARQMSRLLADSQRNEARSFAESYGSFDDEPSKGFSPVVRAEIEKAHLAISERTFSPGDLKELVDTMASKTSVVDRAESGSSRANESLAVSGNPRQQFAALVRNAMTEDSLTREAAIRQVSQQNPELAKAYMESGMVRR